jgi:hypothetical protein
MNRQTEHRTIVLPYELFEGGAIAQLSSADEMSVIDASRADLLF